MLNSVLTVCVGNVCRSPVAEAALRKYCPNLKVASAGLAAPEGKPASSQMIELAAKDGLDLTNHKARNLSSSLPERFDLILVMEEFHLKEIARVSAHLRARSMLLTNWSGSEDIPDPINKNEVFFTAVYEQIIKASRTWAAKLDQSHD
jgi:protein-tyrosine phosphatase